MMQEVRIAFAAASAAKAAAQAAVAATNLLYHDPSAWAFADEAYWLCKTAAKAAEYAADNLCPEWAENEVGVAAAYAAANEAATDTQEMADELVSLAEAAGHEIRR